MLPMHQSRRHYVSRAPARPFLPSSSGSPRWDAGRRPGDLSARECASSTEGCTEMTFSLVVCVSIHTRELIWVVGFSSGEYCLFKRTPITRKGRSFGSPQAGIDQSVNTFILVFTLDGKKTSSSPEE